MIFLSYISTTDWTFIHWHSSIFYYMHVRVITSARIHLGIVDPVGISGRIGMCVGIAIEEPKNIIEIVEISEIGTKHVHDVPEIEDVARRIENMYNVDVSRFSINIVKTIPRHVGLGSTTQLKLSIAVGLLEALGLKYNIEDLAYALGRGEISGIGTYAFKYGGFIVDGGKKNKYDFPRLLLRLEFPEDWYILVVIPQGRGPDEIMEHKLFTINYDIDKVKTLTYILINKIIPSIIDNDFETFCENVELFQKIVGSMFSTVQGGIYNSHSIKVIEMLKNSNVKGIGQSSWGPTVYGFVDDYDRGLDIVLTLRKMGYNSFITKARNRGTIILKR